MLKSTLLLSLLCIFLLSCSTQEAFYHKEPNELLQSIHNLPTFNPIKTTLQQNKKNQSLSIFSGFIPEKENFSNLQFLLKASSSVPHPRVPVDLLFLIDISGSMATNNKLRAVKKGLLELLEKLHPQDRISIVLFDEQPELWLLFTKIAEKENIREHIHRIYPRGGSNLTLALEKSYRIFETQNRKSQQHIILITDGPEKENKAHPFLLSRISDSFESKHIMLSVLGLGVEHNQDSYIKLARAGRGWYYFAPKSQQIRSILGKLVEHFFNIVASHIEIDVFFEDFQEKTEVHKVYSHYPQRLDYPEYKFRIRDMSVQEQFHFGFYLKTIFPKKSKQLCRISLKYKDLLQNHKVIHQSYKIDWEQPKEIPVWLTEQLKNYQVAIAFKKTSKLFKEGKIKEARQTLESLKKEKLSAQEISVIKQYASFLNKLPQSYSQFSEFWTYFAKQLYYQSYVKEGF